MIKRKIIKKKLFKDFKLCLLGEKKKKEVEISQRKKKQNFMGKKWKFTEMQKNLYPVYIASPVEMEPTVETCPK